MPRTSFAGAILESGPTGALHVDERRGSVAGTFDGVAFTFTMDGDVRSAMVRDADGRPLVESTLCDGIETTTFLGRLTLFGAPRDLEPRVVGDKTAMAELAARPEAALFHAPRDALELYGVARDLFAARKTKGTPQHLAAGERTVIATWSWWWPTAIDVWSWSGAARYSLVDGAHEIAETVHGWRRVARPWSWWSVTVTNLYSAETLGVDGTLL